MRFTPTVRRIRTPAERPRRRGGRPSTHPSAALPGPGRTPGDRRASHARRPLTRCRLPPPSAVSTALPCAAESNAPVRRMSCRRIVAPVHERTPPPGAPYVARGSLGWMPPETADDLSHVLMAAVLVLPGGLRLLRCRPLIQFGRHRVRQFTKFVPGLSPPVRASRPCRGSRAGAAGTFAPAFDQSVGVRQDGGLRQ